MNVQKKGSIPSGELEAYQSIGSTPMKTGRVFGKPQMISFGSAGMQLIHIYQETGQVAARLG